MKFRKGIYYIAKKISKNKISSVHVDGYISTENEELGYHKEKTGLYSITHIPSGLRICTVLTSIQAKEMIQKLIGAGIKWPSLNFGVTPKRKTKELNKAYKILKDFNNEIV